MAPLFAKIFRAKSDQVTTTFQITYVDLLKTLALYLALQIIRLANLLLVMPLLNKMDNKLTMGKLCVLSLGGLKGAFMLVLAIVAHHNLSTI